MSTLYGRPGSAARADAVFRSAAPSKPSNVRHVQAASWADAYATALEMQNKGDKNFCVKYDNGEYTLKVTLKEN